MMDFLKLFGLIKGIFNHKTKAIVILILCILVGLGSAILTKKDDGILEESAESIINDILKTDIDLTPDSKEI